MSRLTRRTFLQSTLAAGATVAIGGTKSSGNILGANDTIRVAVAGLNGRGGSHVGEFADKEKMERVQVTHLVDPDTGTFAKRVKQVESKGGPTPKTVQDIRRVLDSKDVDVVTIATPNHWHALMTIWACQAGKDVYVEKPCSHNVHEGRIAVETARKYNRIVQHGTQSRSGAGWDRTAALVRSGELGKLLVSRGLCYKLRKSIGFKEPTPVPENLDFGLWLGPATERPFHRNLVHYEWHWFWDFGNGDIGNQGVHEMDKARWMIPGATLPKTVFSLGGRFGYTDQGETPNTQLAVMDFGETLLVFEVRGLPTKPFLGLDRGVGNTLHFESGTVADGKFYPKGSDKAQPLPPVKSEPKLGPGDGNFGNFIAAVRSRKVSDLNADIQEGHYSSALCHLANISYRLGETVSFNGSSKRLGEARPEVAESLGRMEEHLRGVGVKLDGTTYRLGRTLNFDAKSEKFVGDNEANRLLTREYRAPFVVPEKVV
jgi:predicted dehydrogenase